MVVTKLRLHLDEQGALPYRQSRLQTRPSKKCTFSICNTNGVTAYELNTQMDSMHNANRLPPVPE